MMKTQIKELALDFQPRMYAPDMCVSAFGIDSTSFLGVEGLLVVSMASTMHIFLTEKDLQGLIEREARFGYNIKPLLEAYVLTRSRVREAEEGLVPTLALYNDHPIMALRYLKWEMARQRLEMIYTASSRSNPLTDEEIGSYDEACGREAVSSGLAGDSPESEQRENGVPITHSDGRDREDAEFFVRYERKFRVPTELVPTFLGNLPKGIDSPDACQHQEGSPIKKQEEGNIFYMDVPSEEALGMARQVVFTLAQEEGSH